MEPDEIARRVRKLRGLSQAEIARRAKVTPETITRIVKHGQRPYHLTRDSLTDAIIEAELDLRDYLVELHGPGEGRAA